VLVVQESCSATWLSEPSRLLAKSPQPASSERVEYQIGHVLVCVETAGINFSVSPKPTRPPLAST